jgi:hypothetical protein
MPLTFDQVAAQVPSNLTTTRFPSINDANSKITDKMKSSLTVKSYTFPTDLPKHHFVIYEYQMIGAVARDLCGVYRLPLPSQLRDSKQIRFDNGFNIAHDAKMLAAGAAGWGLAKIFGEKTAKSYVDTAQAVAGVAGEAARVFSGGNLALNNFNWVTLSTPNFHQWGINFVFRPKSHDESIQIRDMVNNIKANMHPTRFTGTNGLVLSFPNIFVCAFSLPQYLFKFKPAVFNSITTEYSTTMFKVDGASVPEYIIVSLNAHDLEIWTKENFAGHASAEPFTAITQQGWYT